MSTNPPGYLRRYYRRERKRIILILGGMCSCGATRKLHIHHKNRWTGKKKRGRGRMERLTDWKKNMNQLEVKCPKCHGAKHREMRKCPH
jgi:hypothetical protein